MREPDEVDLWLDLRNYHRAVGEPEAFRRFWEELEPALEGQRLVAGKTHEIAAGNETLRLNVMRAPPNGAVVSAETRFSIRGLLEPPALRYACRICRAEGQSSYGPFTCPGCPQSGDSRVCDRHVTILDGSMRSTCQDHVPVCACGSKATFWCQGPACRRQRSWCNQHRRQHANDPDHAYCEACYAAVYPGCERQGCERVGTLACEHVEAATLELCGKRACPSHMTRWQVFGPEKEGLTLCQAHRGVNRLDDRELVQEIILSTAARRVTRRHSPLLPSLQSVRHILRKARGRLYELDAIGDLFSSFALSLDRSPSIRRAVSDLLAQHATRRTQDRSRDQAERAQGMPYFERLKSELIARGKFEIAAAVSFSDYRPKQKWLFVTVPEVYKGMIVGRGGRTINELSESIGAVVKLERSGSGGRS